MYTPAMCCQVFQGSVKEVIYCCLRRGLCYPLYRHWKLLQDVLQDTRDLFHLGIIYCTTASRRSEQFQFFAACNYYVLSLMLLLEPLIEYLLVSAV